MTEYSDTKGLVVLAVWAIVAIIALGITRELSKDWDEVFDAAPQIVLWPLFIGFLAVVAVGWCLLWLGRGPVRFVCWLARRHEARAAAKSNLPRAQVRRP